MKERVTGPRLLQQFEYVAGFFHWDVAGGKARENQIIAKIVVLKVVLKLFSLYPMLLEIRVIQKGSTSNMCMYAFFVSL